MWCITGRKVSVVGAEADNSVTEKATVDPSQQLTAAETAVGLPFAAPLMGTAIGVERTRGPCESHTPKTNGRIQRDVS